LSNTLDVDFCLEALEEALSNATPDIFNTDQGSQFTALSFTGRLSAEQIKISMDGRGRALDNRVHSYYQTINLLSYKPIGNFIHI
jgi:putative transposase